MVLYLIDTSSIALIILSLIMLALAIAISKRVKWFSEARAMTAPAFALTLIPAFYTVFGTSYQIDLMNWDGIIQYWNYAVSWYPGYILMIVLGVMIRSTGQHLTLPDRFAKYSQISELISSFVCLIYLMPLDVMLAFGIIGSIVTGYIIPMEVFIIIGGLYLIYFTSRNGWAGYSLPGILFFVAMTGIAVTGVMMVNELGGLSVVLNNVPEGHLVPWFTDIGGFIDTLKNPATFVWFLMGSAFLIDPMVWQRVSLAESEKSVRNGMIFAILFWGIFDVITVFTGLAVRSIGEDLYYLDVAYEYLPVIWGSLMLTSNFLVAMAGGSAYLHAAGMIFSQNIAKSLGLIDYNVLATDEESEAWYKKGVTIIGGATIALTLILNFLMPNDPTTTMWLINSGILFGSLAFPLIFGGIFYREIIPDKAVNYGIIFGLAITLLCIVGGFIAPNYHSIITLGITPETASGTPLLDASRILGFGASIIGWLIGYAISFMQRRG